MDRRIMDRRSMDRRINDEEGRTTPKSTVTEGYLASGTSLGSYQILKKLGEGGMGVVYAAEHPIHGRVAVKLLSERLAGNEEFKKRFIREIKLMQKINHPNIVGYIGADVDQASGKMFLVTEYVSGSGLDNVIRDAGSIPYKYAVSISSQICDALSVIHEAGIVHRDLKPGNIMLLDDETAEDSYLAKVLDFGIARFSKDVQQKQSMSFTRLGGVIGTPEYLSPEQAKGEKLDHRSDIYSLGIIMYEMLTGKVPFEADTPEKVAIMHAMEEPPRIHERCPDLSIPKGLESVIMASLEKDPHKRFQSAQEMKDTMRARTIDVPEVPAAAAAVAEPFTDVKYASEKLGSSFGKRKSQIAAIILSACGMLGLGIYYVSQQESSPAKTEKAEELVSCRFTSEPSGALIAAETSKGTIGARTPFTREIPAYEDLKEVNVALEGYESRSMLLMKPISKQLQDRGAPCAYHIQLRKKLITCELTTQPPGTELYKISGGMEHFLGKGPLQVEIPEGQQVTFIARLEGYKEHPHTKSVEEPCNVLFTMKKEEHRGEHRGEHRTRRRAAETRERRQKVMIIEGEREERGESSVYRPTGRR